jgi:DNA-binding PadR family transcriptional regulator
VAKRSEVLELAVLGLLHEGPRHGYELRKDLGWRLGRPYAVSYGSLYPTLRCLLDRGLTCLEPPGPGGGRARLVYAVTPQGRRHFEARICAAGAVDDDSFDVHFAFFARAGAEARLHVLEGRRGRLLQQRERLRGPGDDEPDAPVEPTDPTVSPDRYRRELRRHGLECVERELRWVNRQIELERQSTSPRSN